MKQAGTFKAALAKAALEFGDMPFLLDDPLLGTVSYGDLLRFAQGLDKRFVEDGIPIGASVATSFHNCGLAAVLFLATIAARRTLVPLNPLSSKHEIDHALRKARCHAVLFDPAHTKHGGHSQTQATQIRNHREYFEESCADGFVWPTQEIDVTDEKTFVGEVVFTSGSTGLPKGVLLTERSLLADASALIDVLKFRRADRFLTVCPLFHNSGQIITTLACALVGGVTFPVKSDLGMLNFWAYVDMFRIQWSMAMNSFLALLLSCAGGPADPTVMRGLLTGGSAIDGSVVKRFESRFGVPVRTVYGLTETASVSTCEYLDPQPRSFGSSGRPLPLCRVRIRSERKSSDDSFVAYERGEIMIRGEHLFEGYIGDSQLTSNRKRGGWLYTGDVGYFDESGNLFVVDRMDSMLIVGGENVYPSEVENLCALLSGAAQVVLAGVHHDVWGVELALVYKLNDGASANIGAWHQVLSERLSPAKIPQKYVAVSDLELVDFPRKENGKLDRRMLRSLLERHLLRRK